MNRGLSRMFLLPCEDSKKMSVYEPGSRPPPAESGSLNLVPSLQNGEK